MMFQHLRLRFKEFQMWGCFSNPFRAKFALVGIFLFASLLSAQINTGRITGIVTDSSGAWVSGAIVRATNQDTSIVTTSKTQSNGDYLVNFLIPGTYTVEIESQGFRRSRESGVAVAAGEAIRIDIALQLGEVRQSVEVQAHPVAVNTESAELSQTFGYKALDQLPNIDRNPLYQMNLLPGANNGAGSGNYGTNGGENGIGRWLVASAVEFHRGRGC